MATDATGTPTSLGIPKFNTSVDAPSGLGSNAQMDVLDTLITARVSKPSGIVSGEVPVWNGTTWVRSSATNIGPTSLGSGTPDATKFLRGDGSWQVPPNPVTILRKTTQKNVVSSITQTDLLNGEITLPILTTTSIVRIRAWGAMVNTTGSAQILPSFQVILGGTSLTGITGVGGPVWGSGNSTGWVIDLFINNTGATNSQVANIEFRSTIPVPGGSGSASTNSSGGYSYIPAPLGGVAPIYGQAQGSYAANTAVTTLLQIGVTNALNSANYATALYGALVEVI